MFLKQNIFLMIFLFFLANSAYGKKEDPITVNATVTESSIIFSPAAIPEDTPFILHVINQTNTPVELENSDTSVEIFGNTDKTFKVGLSVGSYVFFNDFNAHTKPATLLVKTAAELEKKSSADASLPIQNNHSEKQISTQLNASEILFIIWRESVEALLVVGIVYSWLKQLKEGRKSGMFFLWLGVALGALFAILLSFLLLNVEHALSPIASNYFQASLTLIACIMIVYMVKWMRNHSKKMKPGMHHSLEKNSSNRWRNISILTVVAIAFAREASEAVIFISALGLGNAGYSFLKMSGLVTLGLILAAATIYILQLGNKIFSWRFFFKVTEILLLLLGGGLLLHGVDLLISSGCLPVLYAHIWDTSFLLGEGGFFAPMISSFTGYRPSPSLMSVMVYLAYWCFIYLLLQSNKKQKNAN